MADPIPKVAEHGPVAVDLFDPGVDGFSDGVIETFEEGTIVASYLANAVAGEFYNVCKDMNVTLDGGVFDQHATIHRAFNAGLYGDGSDGDVVIGPGTTTLTRDMFYQNLTVQALGFLETAGFRVFVSDTLTIESTGAIRNNGGDGVDGAGGGFAGTGAPAGTVAGGASGGVGTVAVGVAGTGATDSGGGAGGSGGDTGDTGGPGGTPAPPAATFGSFRTLTTATTGEVRGLGGAAWLTGGAGAGGGAGSVGNVGGGGAGGGGVVLICAFKVVLDGDIQANGGVGGVGQLDASGGGGGGGGVVFLVCRAKTGTGNISKDGGAGGAAGGGAGTNPGVAGVDGSSVILTA
jgi:hypothetical protein